MTKPPRQYINLVAIDCDDTGGFIIGIFGDDAAPGLYIVPKPQRGN